MTLFYTYEKYYIYNIIIEVCSFLRMAAAVLKTRSTLQMGSSLQRVDANTISVPQLPDKKEWLAEYDVEILMLDG